MKVDYALILAAGKGTRMGEIGKQLPKVLWPVYEKSILELEVLYALELGIKKIFINTFNYKEKIKEYFQQSEILQKATLIEENEKLDIGGAVHNLAQEVSYKGNLIIFNSDQFIFLTKENWDAAFERFNNSDHLIFSYDVNSNDLYNALDSQGHKLTGIISNEKIERNSDIMTYTGMSLIKLDKLNPSPGESKFFNTVANYSDSNVSIFNIKDSEYWDFGTLKRYKSSMQNILEKANKSNQFVDFLIRNDAFIKAKTNLELRSYNSDTKNCLNLTNEKLDIKNSIILKTLLFF